MKNLTSTFLFLSLTAVAQFDPAAGQAGSHAVHKDSLAIVGWASGCKVIRGYQNIAEHGLGFASAGDSSMAIGASDAGIVSLGDGGSAILTFEFPIVNGAGNDFAVFENGFSDTYLELAFVEVSSDGINYFRFPATSNTDTTSQIGGFGALDATHLNNLAGKYKAQYGAPFDLEELKNEIGLDVNSITHIKVIDVVGNIDAAYTSRDKNNHKINDPWPTPYASSGFDLEAVGVLNMQAEAVEENKFLTFTAYPNPASTELQVNIQGADNCVLNIVDMQGRVCGEYNASGLFTLNVAHLEEGIYILKISSFNKVHVGKFSKM
ncbi:MAG: T9SS type A sorting domain-containing protein [Bacteroidetes bacterium]|nr:T9SS type A sorting domain-containing protein [Bacteroidota bacterium]